MRSTTHDERVAWFIHNACPDHHVRGGPAHVRAIHTAARILERYPDIAHDSFYTSIVCGDLAEVERVLSERPEAANEKGGPKGWEPLLYLCFTRVPLAASNLNLVAIARALMDHGADPRVYFMAGDSRYTPLVGVIGEGEEDRPGHPRRDELARLLLERGADPYDIQVIYNTGFHGEILWLLELIYEHSVKAGRKTDWDDPEWRMLDMGGYGCGARWLLNIAVRNNDLGLAEWILTHGATPNPAPPRDARLGTRSLNEDAQREGFTEMADLLVRFGATPSVVVLDDEDAFAAACLRLDRTKAQALLAAHPEYLHSTKAIFAAAERDRADVVSFLLDTGMSPDVEDERKQRPLHMAAYGNALRVAELLIQRGAAIDPVESNWDNTPLGAAVYNQHARMIELLGRFSRDIWELTYVGNVERVRELLSTEPDRAKTVSHANTPLMWLPDDEAHAMAIASLLLANGADAGLRNKEGKTAADLAERRGLFDAADLLRAAAPESGGSERTGPTDSAPADTETSRPHIEQFEGLAADLLAAYGGDAQVLQRLGDHFERSLAHDQVRAMLQQRVTGLRGSPDTVTDISLADTQLVIARQYGFESWAKLTQSFTKPPSDPRSAPLGMSSTPPFYKIDWKHSTIEPRPPLSTKDWDTIFSVMKEHGITGLNAGGQMTDAVMERVSQLEFVTHLNLGASKRLTDDGLPLLARMPQLQELDLSDYPGGTITDRGLEVVRHLPQLRKFAMCWQRGISDAGVAYLTFCDELESVDLMGTPTGDGAINALSGKSKLRRFKTGRQVTDAGLPLLHSFPTFKAWKGGDVTYSLMSPDAAPTHLMVDGSFTDKGLASIAGLDGVFGLSLFWHVSALTPDALASLSGLPNLGFLGCEGRLCSNEAMRHIAALPKLRMLMAQDTVAGDEGFAALSRSPSLEYIWGRRCHNLQGRGFAAMAAMPALRGLSVSCKNVDDTALSTLPRFPSLREFMPMDVPDAGFRHVGQCEQLEALWCMYCRDTGDAATGYIAGLSNLKSYYAGNTRITDRSLEILGGMSSLERLEFESCAGITDAGVAHLARLPRLREIRLGCPQVTREGAAVFPAHVRVDYGV